VAPPHPEEYTAWIQQISTPCDAFCKVGNTPKEHRLHSDIQKHDRLFYFTTCGWMMWNWLASGATLMLYDGNPVVDDGNILWDFADQEGITHFGTSAKHGGVVIHGRSDATLNPGGVRIGTAEIYRQVEKLFPAKILQVSDIPRTKSGPLVNGQTVTNVASLANPLALEQFRDRPELRRYRKRVILS
jgi:acyl-coenzyme A synthetase/AMP-(fatty) acid ligase